MGMAEAPPAAASADRLDDVLRRSGALRCGSLAEVTVDGSRDTVLSRITRLRLTYDGEAPGAPSSLILKTALPERIGKSAWDAGRQEVAFYNDVAATMHTRLVPHCFEASWEPETRAWHLLLEDLTASHLVATPWPLPPSTEQCEKIVRARAQFHAQWWDDPRLGTTIGNWLPADDSRLAAFDAAVTQFFGRVGDLLPPHRRDLYRRLIDRGPATLTRRYHSHRDMTVVQGDAHCWNCFVPKDGGNDVRFFDWDCWRVDVGTDDLAYMIALHWYPDRRHVLERPLLDLYHATIEAHGISRYHRQSLEADYRLSVLWQIATPVWQSNANIPPVIWWNNLERIMLAVDDLGCRELLG
jgi:Ecdysteroid kinase-like family